MTTGEILPVEGTPMDFRTETAVGARMHENFEQLKNGNGYDHNWVLATAGDVDRTAVRLVSPETGICLSVRTTEPGIQIYSGNFLDGTIKGKGEIVYNPRTGICPTNRNGRLPYCVPERHIKVYASTVFPLLNNLFIHLKN